ncbi:Cysteine desulfurase [Rubrivivax sp. A210]|uniref:cysteine desulfurase family protein n=1 Tax=Rubrivivax sp. A210 TaxID=2772301 RepID=UPI00191AF7A8|nr:cysteine desulfurase family protein [Rubrivivax sp. A210]CAD5371940.1 Cysteine desulfurase [Rubrivivax sp. A210]
MSAELPVYLDHNATTPPLAAVVAEMVDVLQHVWANPSSMHASGQAARRVLADARLRVASFLGCQAAELVFTSGATEANHMAVLGALAAQRGRRRILLSAVEHPGLLALARRLQGEGVAVDLIPVDSQGRLDQAAAQALMGEDLALVSVMGANNETGVLMPTATVAAMARACGAWMHVDATQLAGKAALHFGESGADLMSVSAHKFGGPKGVGALMQRKGLVLPPLLSGRQERQRRGGTENLSGIAGFAAACDHAAATLAQQISGMGSLRDRLERGLVQAWPQIRIYGREAERLANTCCFRLGDLPAERVLDRLERAGVLASSGAACSAGGTQPSHVLLAMGESPLHAKGGVRLSLGTHTTPADIAHTLRAVAEAVAPLLQAAALSGPLFNPAESTP